LKLIVGLGNPGRAYAATRHNVGWWAVDQIAESWGFDKWKKDGQSLVSNGRLADVRVRLIKPQTYMNLSGEVLIQYRRRPAWNPSTDLLVLLDEVALPVGRIRIRAKGSPGGHNGLKSIEAHVGTQEYARLRIGIRPEHQISDLSDFVLAPFSRADATIVRDTLTRVEQACETWIRDGAEKAMNLYNREPRTDESRDDKLRDD
jgi:PTH1 family peptidyl-tRNA hydrolase